MLPTVEHSPDGKVHVMDEAPISTWRQLSAYDTASECEKARKAGSVGALTRRDLDSAVTMNDARCVPADAVYPPIQPTP
jgi:hypothetical protein